MRRSLRWGVAVVAGCAMSLVAVPAFAAPGPGNGVQAMQFTCGDTPVTVLTRANASHANQNWAAGYVVDMGTVLPVSFSFSLYDDTAHVSLGGDTTVHANAHRQQQTITCSESETSTVGELGPPPGGVYPPGVGPKDTVTFTITVVAALPGSGN